MADLTFRDLVECTLCGALTAYERRPQHLEWHARLNARLLQPQRAAAGTVEQGWLPPLPIRKVGWFGLPLYEALVCVTVMNGQRQWHFQKIWGYRRAVQYMKRSPWPGLTKGGQK